MFDTRRKELAEEFYTLLKNLQCLRIAIVELDQQDP